MKAAQFPGDALWPTEWMESSGERTIQERSKTTSPSFLLYSSWFCPFAQRAWIAAEESGVDYKWIEINPYQVNPDNAGGYSKISLSLEEKAALHPGFVEASPRGLIPAIRHGNSDDSNDIKVVWESLPVAEYIDSEFGSGQLAGTTPYERAKIQIWSAHCTERIQKEYYRALMSQDETVTKKSVTQFYEECRALSRAMADNGPYFLGDRFSLVDVAFAPFWQRMLWVGGHYFNLTFPDEPEFERLSQWWEACQQRPSIKSTLVCKERLIASYTDYDRDLATSDVAMSLK